VNNLQYPQTSFTNDLCEYYGVNLDTAIKLGTRSDGRRPDLPGSKTCKAISGKTLEDIWSQKDRDALSDIFDFYIDQGSWSSFRQVVRHNDLVGFHMQLLQFLFKNIRFEGNPVILEYGCGVAPFCRTLIEFIDEDSHAELLLSDVDGCEHLAFGEWRVKKRIKERDLNIHVDAVPVCFDKLPTYDKKIDIAFIFEVLEHVPSPLECIQNITSHMRQGSLLVENFIKHHDDHDDDGPDLLSAKLERDSYYKFLTQEFVVLTGETTNPDATRVWRKK
jgi:hypothetical protein